MKVTTFLPLMVGLLLGAIPMLIQPEESMNISFANSIALFWVLGPFIGSFLLYVLQNEKASVIGLSVSGGVVIGLILSAIVASVFLERDPGNLIGLFVIICWLITLFSSLLGTYMAYLFKKLKFKK